MSALYERMTQDMQLRGLSVRTQVSYTRTIRQLAKHYHKAPDLITQEELRDYFLYRKNVSRCRVPRLRLRYVRLGSCTTIPSKGACLPT